MGQCYRHNMLVLYCRCYGAVYEYTGLLDVELLDR